MFPITEIEAKDTHGYSKLKYWNCWQLKTQNGRQVWEFEPPMELASRLDEAQEFLKEMSKAFEFDKRKNPNSGDKVYRSQSLPRYPEIFPDQIEIPKGLNQPLSSKAFVAALKGVNYYQSLQAKEGHWPGDYGGPLFLLPGLIIASCVTETPFPIAHRELM